LADRAVIDEPGVPAGAGDFPLVRPRSATSRRYFRIACGMALPDALALDAALVLTRLAQSGLRPVGPGFLVLLVLAPMAWVAIFASFHLYSISRLSPAEEFRRVLEATGVAVGVKLAVSFLWNDAGIMGAISHGWLALAAGLSLLFVLIERQAWHKHMGRLRVRGELSYRTLILGANEEAVKIAESLQPLSSGFTPVGLVRTDFGWVNWDGVPVLGSVDQLSAIVEENQIESVFVASSAVGPDLMKRVTKYLRRHDLVVHVSANITDFLTSTLTVQRVGSMLSLALRPVRLSGSQTAVKRTFDLLVSGVSITLLAPMWLVLALLIRSTSRGPVLFRQQRIGQGGRPFTMIKFRSMVHGAELMITQLVDRNEASGALFKIRDDPRVTTVGRWIRRWSLDELPQLLNVFKGDMSLVGPRPPLPNEVAVYEDWHHGRLEVRPGITGLWQVGGRSELTFDDYVRLDLFYIENWSISYDLFILGKTIPAVLFRKGAF
jgi:exopolysaccharide biosynthesis polyprenyl glycosylphosphotransferase